MVKRGQIKIQQMAFMLMAIMIFFVLVGMFFLMLGFAGLRESSEELNEKNALLLVDKLANSPEFSCGDSFGSNKVNCIDADKIMSLKKVIGHYEDFWGRDITNILIRKIPFENGTCKSSNYPNCGLIGLFSDEFDGFPVENFVTLCIRESAHKDVCQIAKLVIYYGD